MNMQSLLEALYQGKGLSRQQSEWAMEQIVYGEANETEIAAFLVALKIKGETAEEIAGAALALRKSALPFSRPDECLLDSCGTGGDGLHTINISTLVGLVAAECGVKVAKHGNRAVSSRSGSSDLLARLGVKLDCSPQQSRRCLEALNFCFLMAPHYHPGVKFAMPVRQRLKSRTLFNLIGPLANPAAPEVQLLGVYDAKLLLAMAEALRDLSCKEAFVVNGGGLDEIALHTETQVAHLHEGAIKQFTITPEQAGLQRVPLAELQVDASEDMAAIARAILNGSGQEAHNQVLALNTAAALLLYKKVSSLKEGTELALRVLAGGRVAARLQNLAALSHA